jgi:hypothetical protein
MKAIYNADTSGFKQHKDVHVVNVHNDLSHANYSKDEQDQFEHHMKQATKHFNDAPKDFEHKTKAHSEHLKTYINSTVKTGDTPSVKGYTKHLTDHFTKKAAAVKTKAAIDKHTNDMHQHVNHVNDHHEHFQGVLNMHHHLEQAKNVLVHALSRSQDKDVETHIAGHKVKPEGFVVSRNNRPTKFNDRKEFNRLNFLARSK